MRFTRWTKTAARITAAISGAATGLLACPNCYSGTAAGEQGIAALRTGVLILFLPAAAISGSLLLLMWRRKNGPARQGGAAAPASHASGETPAEASAP